MPALVAYGLIGSHPESFIETGHFEFGFAHTFQPEVILGWSVGEGEIERIQHISNGVSYDLLTRALAFDEIQCNISVRNTFQYFDPPPGLSGTKKAMMSVNHWKLKTLPGANGYTLLTDLLVRNGEKLRIDFRGKLHGFFLLGTGHEAVIGGGLTNVQ